MASQCSQNSSKTGQSKEMSRKLAPREEQWNQWRNKIAGVSTWIGQFLCGLLKTFLIHSRRQSGACRRHVPPRTGHLSRPMGVAGLLSAENKGLTRIETNSLPAPGKKLPDLGGMIVGLTYSCHLLALPLVAGSKDPAEKNEKESHIFCENRFCSPSFPVPTNSVSDFRFN